VLVNAVTHINKLRVKCTDVQEVAVFVLRTAVSLTAALLRVPADVKKGVAALVPFMLCTATRTFIFKFLVNTTIISK
jgi:hypothetical protein